MTQTSAGEESWILYVESSEKIALPTEDRDQILMWALGEATCDMHQTLLNIEDLLKKALSK